MPKIEMNLSDYLRVIRKRKRIIILSFVLVLLSTLYYTFKQTRIYQTSSTVKIEQRKSVAEILTELITWSPGDEMASQANLISSYQIMEKVAEKLNLISQDMNPIDRMARAKGLQGQISAAQVGNTNMISISAVSSNPRQAMELANTVALVYVETHFENKKQEASNVKSFVKTQLDYYLSELQKGEAALQKFRQDNPLVVERDTKSLPPMETDSRLSRLKEEIVNLELELAALKSKYTEEHPEIKALKRRMEKTNNDFAVAVNQITAQQKALSAKEIELLQLKRNVTIAEDIYLMFKQKYEEASILEAEKAQDVTIVEPASLPSSPIKPDINFNIMIGLFSGLLIGLIMAFVVESFDTTIGRLDDIEELIQVPVLGVIPNTSLEKGKRGLKNKFIKRKKISEKDAVQKKLIALFTPTSPVAEAYKSLRTHLDYIGDKKEGMSIVITSATPEEGKTQTVANLGIVLAQSGQKVLVVGADFRKPMIYRLFGLKKSPGLSEVLIGKLSWEKVVNNVTDILLGGFEYERILKSTGIENLNIITCGENPPNPAELLNFPQFSDLVKELKQEYDVILFDSPPTLPVTDSAVLGTKTDGVILVYQAGRTPRQALIRAKTQLENVDAKIWGVVINNVKADFMEDDTYYQRYRYYRYYGEEKKSQSPD
ncbi:MAG: GumC family protein [Candidatus Aminicenantaceae bacterium]